MATFAISASVPSPPIRLTRRPPTAAAKAKTEPLYAIRIGGRCSISWMRTGAAKATSTPASQPKSTIALAAKTNESETPPLLGPSIGTG